MDFNKVTEMAKDIMLKAGEMPRSLFVEMDSRDMIIVGVVGEDDTTYKRGLGMFLAGRSFAEKKLKKRRITGLCQADEVWVTGNVQYRGHASFDPNRKEALNIVYLDNVSSQEPLWQKTVIYELIRGQGGQLTDLLSVDGGEPLPCLGLGIAAFLSGVQTRKQDYSLAIHTYRRLVERYSILLDQTERSLGAS